MEETPGPFMINLAKPLFALGHVSFGRKTNELTPDGMRVDAIDPDSRQRNHDARGTNQNTGDIMFDHIYVSPTMLAGYEQGSAAVFDNAVAARDNNSNSASDHLPVFADFTLGSGDGRTAVARVIALLPNPAGQDAGNEAFTFGSTDGQAVTVGGSGIVPAMNSCSRAAFRRMASCGSS